MNEHKNIITIEDEIKEFSDKPVKSSAIFKALQNIGGMPEDYPYEATTLFEGSVEYADNNADIEGVEAPEGMPIKITINGTTTDLFYIQEESFWSDTESADDSTIQFGNGVGGSPAWLWMNEAPDGTYAVKIDGNGINENFESAVKEIIGWKPFYEADLAAQEMKPYDSQLLEEHPLAICKAYINGIETPIAYMGQISGMTIWQMEHLVSEGTDITVSIGILGEDVFIGASQPCHIAIAESSDTNIVISSTYKGSGYVLEAAPTDIMEALKRKKYSFSLAVESNEAPQSYGIYPLTFEYYYNGSMPELHAQSLMIFGDSMDGAVDTEHNVFIFSGGSDANV